MKTSRQLHGKPSFQVNWNSILPLNRARLIKYEQFRCEIQAHIEARRIKSHLRQLLQRALQLRWMWTALAKKGKKGKTGKGDGKNGKIGGKGQNQSQHPNPSKDAVCWLESKESVWLWWNPKNKGGKGNVQTGTGKGAGSLEQSWKTSHVQWRICKRFIHRLAQEHHRGF